MALKGLKVIEVAGLAPAPFCGMILSDFGADVIRVERPGHFQLDSLKRGKRTASIDLKNDKGKGIFRKLCSTSDVLIEPFRPGVMERLGLGPAPLLDLNKRLIYARLSGFGQHGNYAKKAGHDLNYLAVSGVLSLISSMGKPTPPINMLADFAGGGQTCALGILTALFERNNSGLGQVVDVSMVEGARYVSSYMWHTQKSDAPACNYIWPNKGKKEANLLDGGAPFYTVYKTKDGRWLSVAAIEPQFYKVLLDVLKLNDVQYAQYDIDQWPDYMRKFSEIFASKSLKDWTTIFGDHEDSCVEPVLEIGEAEEHDRLNARPSFLEDHTPSPAPLLSRTPARPSLTESRSGEDTVSILREFGYGDAEIEALSKDQVIYCAQKE